MNKPSAYVAVVLSIATLGLNIAAPAVQAKTVAKTKKRVRYHITVSAIPGADERNFSDPASRCLTASMKSLDASAVKTMNADIAAHGAGHATAVATYKEKIATIWYAMEQPYCGFGAYGLSAVTHSFEKSVDRVRAEFLASAK